MKLMRACRLRGGCVVPDLQEPTGSPHQPLYFLFLLLFFLSHGRVLKCPLCRGRGRRTERQVGGLEVVANLGSLVWNSRGVCLSERGEVCKITCTKKKKRRRQQVIHSIRVHHSVRIKHSLTLGGLYESLYSPC